MATKFEERENSRISFLAAPKRVPRECLEDRRSVYWVDRQPPKAGPNGVTVVGKRGTRGMATPRVQELARHRPPVTEWKGDRPTPVWPVRKGALNASVSQRILDLCLHKEPHSRYQFDRTAYMQVATGATSASASSRIEGLAKPKVRNERFGQEDKEWGQSFPVSEAAKKANPTERLDSLAEYKKYHALFKEEKSVEWPVTDAALGAIASLRLQQLCRPRSRTMIKDDYDPYRVTHAARKAHATPRVVELCVPLPRKCRQKKIV